MASIRRAELQDLLAKSKTHSFSVVGDLRWDLKQIIDMATTEGILRLNPRGASPLLHNLPDDILASTMTKRVFFIVA
jgi:hypothetical protein